MPDMAVAGEFGKADLGNEFGPHPARGAGDGAGHRILDRRGPTGQPIEPAPQIVPVAHGKAGADPPGIDQPSAVARREQQRGEGQRLVGRRPADDDEFLRRGCT